VDRTPSKLALLRLPDLPDVLGRDDRESRLAELVFERGMELRPRRCIDAQIGRDKHVRHRDGLDPAPELVGRDPEGVGDRCAAGRDQGGDECCTARLVFIDDLTPWRPA
jgi:hypothetical protein